MANTAALRDELHRIVDELEEEDLPAVLRILRDRDRDEAAWYAGALELFARHFDENEEVYTEADARPREHG